jgi:transposase-like protein
MYAVRLADGGRSVATLRVHLAAILGARRLARFNGVPRASFPLFLKECECRFNHRHDDLYRLMLGAVRRNPLDSQSGQDS